MPDKIISDITDYIFVSDKPRAADIIFVPGGIYPQLAERAAELYKTGFAPFIMPSGRFSVKNGRFAGVKEKAEIYNGDYATECEFYTDVLQKNGVPQSAIIGENKSEHTRDNAFLSRVLCDANNIKVKVGLICCMSFHSRRCLTLYKLAFPEAEIFVCPINCHNITRENWYRSGYGVDRVMGELSRCGSQLVGDIKHYLNLTL
jgi:Uncharacterized conserved protein